MILTHGTDIHLCLNTLQFMTANAVGTAFSKKVKKKIFFLFGILTAVLAVWYFDSLVESLVFWFFGIKTCLSRGLKNSFSVVFPYFNRFYKFFNNKICGQNFKLADFCKKKFF